MPDSQVPFLYLKNKKPFLSGRLTSSRDLALSIWLHHVALR